RGRVVGHVPDAIQAWLRDAVAGHLAYGPGLSDDPTGGARDRGAGRNLAKVLLHLPPGLRQCDVAGQNEHGVRRPVVASEPRMDVVQARSIEVFHRTDGAVRIGVPGW